MSDGIQSPEAAAAVAQVQETRSADPGDQTERNFRYQHQYGVVLLLAVRRGRLNYTSIYCEHHEDFLCERPDGMFDGYQIKTSRPEGGAWTLTSPAFVKTIARFVELVAAYPGQIGNLFFVSNSDVDRVTDESSDDGRRSRCPGLIMAHVKACAAVHAMKEPYKRAFDLLAAELGAVPEQLFDVFQRLDILKGPSREEFDAALSHEHLGQVPECAHLPPDQLDAIRNHLVATFHRAASLFVTDPDRHLRGLFGIETADPVLAAKRIVCAEIVFDRSSRPAQRFAYLGEPTINLGGTRVGDILEQKLNRGGLTDTVGFMKAREQAAEYYFLEEQAKNAPAASYALRQVEEAVHGECLEAYMAARVPDAQFGQVMFNDVATRLRQLERDRRELLGGRPYEVLMGTAALLTSECRVWWSERFSLRGEPQ